MTDKLKACPFCGGDGATGDDYGNYYIRRSSCGMATKYFDQSADVLRAWNTRAEPKQPTADEISHALVRFFKRHPTWELIFKCIFDELKENNYKIIKGDKPK